MKSEEIFLKDPSLPHLHHTSQLELGQWTLVRKGVKMGADTYVLSSHLLSIVKERLRVISSDLNN